MKTLCIVIPEGIDDVGWLVGCPVGRDVACTIAEPNNSNITMMKALVLLAAAIVLKLKYFLGGNIDLDFNNITYLSRQIEIRAVEYIRIWDKYNKSKEYLR